MMSGSEHSSRESDSESESHSQTNSALKRRVSKSAKPRLTASQKSTNHKDAENKRRNAIRERFIDLAKMVPGAEGQERSEQVMLGKTTEYLGLMLREQRKLEAEADQRGIPLDEKDRLKDTDYGGPKWRQDNLDVYHASKAKKGGPD